MNDATLVVENGYGYAFDVSYACGADTARYPNYHFGQSGERREVDTINLLFDVENGTRWVGLFRRGCGADTSVLPTADPNSACVVADSRAYFVSVLNPQEFVESSVSPVRKTLAVLRHQLLLLHDFQRIGAFRGRNMLWDAVVFDDELELNHVDGDGLFCTGWRSPAGERYERCTVNLVTGAVSALE